MSARQSPQSVSFDRGSWLRALWHIAVATAAAILAYTFVSPWLGDRSGAFPLLLAPLLAAWFGGWRAGVGATILVAALFASLALPPIGDPRVHDGTDRVLLVLFLTAGLSISALCEAFHRTRLRIGQAQQDTQRAMSEIAALDRRLEQALETGRMVAWNWDLATDRITRSGTAVSMFGLSSDRPEHLFERVHPDDVATLKEQVGRAIATQTGYHLLYRVRAPDRSFRWLEDRGRFELNADGHRRLFGAAVDITDRRREEAIARASSARFDAFMSHSPLAAYIKDAQGRYLFVNRSVEERTHRSMAEWLGRRDEDVLDAPTAAAYRRNDQRVLESGEAMVVDEIYAGPEGERHFTSYKFRLEDENGESLLGGISIDVTDAMRASAALRASEDRLREQDRRKDVFLAMLAHELRNPLAPLRNALEALLRLPRDSEAWSKSHAIMDRQLTHATRLLDDLLDVSRITQGKLSLERSRMTLATALDAAIESKRPMLAAADQTLESRGDASDVLVEGDRFRLAQVFANLIDNASKYSPAGSRVVVSSRVSGFQVEVSVQDFGSGIPGDQLPFLFDLFWQATGSGVNASRGLGIGLALVRNLVELHGGSIRVLSEGTGKGSTFIVRLPLAVMGEETAAPVSGMATDLPRVRYRVLVADDNQDAADSLAMFLRADGHDVAVAYDGEAALRAVQQVKPDAAILDLGMPLMDGYEVCRRLRESEAGRGMLIVALSGWGQPEDRRRSEAASFNAHFVKPVQPQTLLDVLAHLRDRPRSPLVPISKLRIPLAPGPRAAEGLEHDLGNAHIEDAGPGSENRS